MHRARVSIVGASGYSGIEATRILAGHEQVELCAVTSDRWVGDTVAKKLGSDGGVGALTYAPLSESVALARESDATLLATPAEVSLDLAPKLLDGGVKVIDLSGAFRLKNRHEYPRFYGWEHPRPELLDVAVYGLSEWYREDIARARLVANPGCYPTAALLATVPLAGLAGIVWGPVIIDAASGVTGAGRKATFELSFAEVAEDFRAYRVGRHQHLPEIAEKLALPVTFTAHLLPIRRGILATIYARLAPDREPREVESTLAKAYSSSPFVEVLATPDEVNLKDVVGTNRCAIGAAVDSSGFDPGRVTIVSAIDNLVKGAAGQAVQNLNIMMGWDETSGLASLRRGNP